MAITPLISFLGVSSFAISPFSPRKVTRHNSNPEQPDRRSGRYDPWPLWPPLPPRTTATRAIHLAEPTTQELTEVRTRNSWPTTTSLEQSKVKGGVNEFECSCGVQNAELSDTHRFLRWLFTSRAAARSSRTVRCACCCWEDHCALKFFTESHKSHK